MKKLYLFLSLICCLFLSPSMVFASTELTTDGRASVDVSVSFESEFTVRIPKSVRITYNTSQRNVSKDIVINLEIMELSFIPMN